MKYFTVLIAILLLLLPPALLAQDEVRIILQSSHDAPVHQLAYNYRGTLIASASEDNVIKIWDNKTGKLIKSFENKGKIAKALAFHPLMNILVSSSGSKILIWDFKKEKVIDELNKHSSDVNTLEFSKNGKFLVSGSDDEKAIVWDFRKRKPKKIMKERVDYVNSVLTACFSSDGKYIYTAGEDIFVKRWEWQKSKKVNEYSFLPKRINSIALNLANDLVAAGGNDSRVRVWSVISGKNYGILDQYTHPVQKIVFDPSKDRLAISFFKNFGENEDVPKEQKTHGILSIWDLNTNDIVWEKQQFGGFRDLEVNPTERAFIACDNNHNISEYDFETGKILRQFGVQTVINDVAIVEDRNEMLIAGENGVVKIWNLDEGILTGKIDTKISGRITSLAYSPERKRLVTAHDSIIRFWRYNTLQHEFQALNTFNVPNSSVKQIAFIAGVTDIVLTRTRSYSTVDEEELFKLYNGGVVPEMASYYNDSSYIEIWNPLRAKCIASFEKTSSSQLAISTNPENNLLAFASTSDKITQLDLSSPDYSGSITISNTLPRDTKKIAQKASANVAGILPLNFNKNKRKATPATALAYGNSTSLLAHATTNGLVQIWDTKKKAIIISKQFENNINSLTFSYGDSLVAISYGNSAQLIDVYSGEVKNIFVGDLEVQKALFTRDNEKLLTIEKNGVIKLWSLTTSSWQAKFININDDDYISITDSLYYRSSLHGVDGLSVTYKNKSYPIEQFSLRYNRPDVVLQKLNCNTSLIKVHKKLHKHRLQRLNYDEGLIGNQFHIPEIEIADRKILRTEVRSRKFTLKLNSDDTEFDLDRINLYVNDVPVYGRNGISLSNFNSSSNTRKVQINLRSGENIIRAEVVNKKGAFSMPQIFHVTSTLEERKANCYVFTFGCDKFVDDKYNMTNKNSELNSLHNFFKENVSVNQKKNATYFNGKLTEKSFAEVSKILKLTQPTDKVIFIIGGHILMDKNLDYYLATTRTNFKKPEIGSVPFTKFADLLNKIPAMNRYVFIDGVSSQYVTDKEMSKITTQAAEQNLQLNRFENAADSTLAIDFNATKQLMQGYFEQFRVNTGAFIVANISGAEIYRKKDKITQGIFSEIILGSFRYKPKHYKTPTYFELLEIMRKKTEREYFEILSPFHKTERITIDTKYWQ